jgi:hypothetical protein
MKRKAKFADDEVVICDLPISAGIEEEASGSHGRPIEG